MRFDPHPYQSYCIDRIIKDDKIGLFLDMGLGKTSITLTAINDLRYNRFCVKKALVIAPKKVAESTWTKEIEKWDHLKNLRVSQILGSADKRVRAVNTPADIYIINRENVEWLVGYCRNEWPFDMVIIDELSSFKSHKAKRFKALTWVRGHIKRIVGLTGTPSPNGLSDLWSELYLLDEGERLGKKITHFRTRYFDANTYAGFAKYSPKPGSDEAIKRLIGDICISMTAKDYLELPECITVNVPVILDSKARGAYNKLEGEAVLQIEQNTIDATTAAVLTNKLLQLCNGAVYDENKDIVEVHDCKIEAFMELVEGLNGQPAVVYYNFKHDLMRLQKALSKTGLRVKELKTVKDQDTWNNHEIDILLAHPASSGHGLNLQAGGNHIIWFSLNWSLELYQQANKRIHRQGQTEKVIIHHLVVEDGMDEDVMASLANKDQTQNSIIEALKVRVDKYRGVYKTA